MTTVGVDNSGLQGGSQPRLAAWKDSDCLVLSLHSSHEPSELLQWPSYDDNSTDIAICIIILITAVIYSYRRENCMWKF